MNEAGRIRWISGPVVRADVGGNLRMMERTEVGTMRLIGEVLGLSGDIATIQVYEETSGLKPDEPVYGTGAPLSVELGPGLLERTFDGVQRPLEELAEMAGDRIARGITAPSLDRKRRWAFTPVLQEGASLHGGEILGTVPETPLIEHRVLAPPDAEGTLTWIASPGEYTVDDPIARVQAPHGERTLTMLQRWPVRVPRPIGPRLNPDQPLLTGQRVIDSLFPIAKGGTAAVPGGFGAGKTVLQHALAKWSDADIVIYIGCGERGNEMTDVLQQFPKLQDPRTGRSLMERTLLVANTSNMPVAAREASIYTGITLAEYYRDMGYDVALMADSTSRWAEALREISGRLEEMPAEEGFPAYLASRLAAFYERAGRVRALSGREGSVTVVGAVSPPGGDFSEPVTQQTQRFVRVFWSLDKTLAAARHFPAVNWLDSYSGYTPEVTPWWQEHVTSDWAALTQQVMHILQQESALQETVRLVGADTLPDRERFVLFVARLIKEAFLQQNAMDQVDAYTTPTKQVALLRLLIHIYERGSKTLDLGAPVGRIQNEINIWTPLRRARASVPNDELAALDELAQQFDEQAAVIEEDYRS